MRPDSEYYHGTLEFTETAIFDFLMGMAKFVVFVLMLLHAIM